MTRPPCPGPCGRSRDPDHYLCGLCWAQLPAATRRSLYQRDADACQRLRELHRQLAAGAPLAEIAVRP